jgi:hypothetical protein
LFLRFLTLSCGFVHGLALFRGFTYKAFLICICH